jgi:hypothetical protein
MRIVSHHNHHYIHMGCLACGHRHELGTLAHDVYDDGEHLGTICDACIALSPEELKATMHEQADALRADADILDSLADDLVIRERVEWLVIDTGEPHADQTPCDRCMTPEELQDVVQQKLAPGDDDEDLPF